MFVLIIAVICIIVVVNHRHLSLSFVIIAVVRGGDLRRPAVVRIINLQPRHHADICEV